MKKIFGVKKDKEPPPSIDDASDRIFKGDAARVVADGEDARVVTLVDVVGLTGVLQVTVKLTGLMGGIWVGVPVSCSGDLALMVLGWLLLLFGLTKEVVGVVRELESGVVMVVMRGGGREGGGVADDDDGQ